jgi:triosephosphate isomerase (TIM)
MAKLLVMNWKMNPATEAEAERIMEATADAADAEVAARDGGEAKSEGMAAEVVVCPPYHYLASLEPIRGSVSLGAQDVAAEGGEAGIGAYTGEESAAMLLSAGVECVIIGHSERRAMGETDELIKRKVEAALAGGLNVILCVGEPAEVRAEGGEAAKAFVFAQLESDLPEGEMLQEDVHNIVIAYEPIWAISTTKDVTPCTPEIANEMMEAIKTYLKTKLSVSPDTLYGGSVTSANIGSFLAHKNIRGALVGGASLKPEEISGMIKELWKSAT